LYHLKAEPEYHYDPKTLSFRRAGFPIGKWVLKASGFLLLSGLVFIGLFRLQNEFLSGPSEQQLRRENSALRVHHEKLTAELEGVSAELNDLTRTEEDLYKVVYLTDRGKADPSAPTAELAGIDTKEFSNITEQMLEKTRMTNRSAQATNAGFSSLYWPGKTDLPELRQYPTLPPVEEFVPERLACGFGQKLNPFNKQMYRHTGVDILAQRGTNVRASGSGRVVETGRNEGPGGQGNFLVIDHGNGYRTRYSMLETISVYYGKAVKQGDAIATIGLSGSSIAPHLHYEIWRNGSAVNPVGFMIQGLEAGQLAALVESGKQTKQSLD